MVVMLGGWPRAAGGQEQAAGAGVTDWTTDLPEGDADVDIALRLAGVRPLPDKQGSGDVVVLLRRRDGKWSDGEGGGHVVAADYNQKSENTADPSRLSFENGGVEGTLSVMIGPDSPRPGAKGFPNPADEFVIELEAVEGEGAVGYEPDREAFMPPWRKDVPTYGGRKLEGRYQGTLKAEGGEGQKVEGTVTGAVAPAVVKGQWGTQGAATIAAAEGGGMAVKVSLSPERVMGPSDAWAVLEFEEPRDLTADSMTHAGLRLVVESEERRDDAAVAVAIKPRGGGWSQVTSAGLLLGERATFDIPYAHFRPTLTHGDLQAVEAVRIGVDSSRGVGDVTFTVRAIETWQTQAPMEKPSAGPTVRIHPDTIDNLNASAEVPKGLFGFHTVHWSPKEPKPDQPEPLQYLRDLNPGLLRPLEHTGFGGKPMSDEEVAAAKEKKAAAGDWVEQIAEASDAEDNMIWTYTEDLWNRPSWMRIDSDESKEQYLAGMRAWWRNLAAKAWTPGDEHNLKRMFEVWNEPFMWGRHINMGVMNPDNAKAWRDPTQYGYLPGTLGAEMYADIFNAAKEGAMSANEHVELGGPSSPSIDGNGYGVLEDYIAPFLAKSADRLDFFTEHHYGGDPAANAASYEVLTAFMDVKYGRRIPIYNTEANNLGASPAGKARYNIADILHPLNTVPDKLKGRSLHALWSGYLRDEGEEHAYRIMSTLRGKRVVSETMGSDALLAAASSPRVGELVVLVLNEGREDATFSLSGVEGFEVGEVMALIADAPEHELRMRDVDGAMIPQPAAGKTVLKEIDPDSMDDPMKFTLPAGSAVRWTLTKEGYEPSKERVRTQHFTDAVLADVEPGEGEGVEATVQWRPLLSVPDHEKARMRFDPAKAIDDERQNAKRAFLRVVTRDVHEGEAVAVIGDTEIPLPWSSSNDSQAAVQMIAIDAALIRENDETEFRVTDPARFNGYTVYAASIVLER